MVECEHSMNLFSMHNTQAHTYGIILCFKLPSNVKIERDLFNKKYLSGWIFELMFSYDDFFSGFKFPS